MLRMAFRLPATCAKSSLEEFTTLRIIAWQALGVAASTFEAACVSGLGHALSLHSAEVL